MKWIIYMNCGYEIKWTVWSSQLWTQFLHLRKEAWKKSGLQRGLKPVTSRYCCDAPTNWAMKPLTLGAGHLRVLMWVQISLKSWIFQASLRNCKNCFHNCEGSQLHLISYQQFIYDPFHISFHRWFIPRGNIGTHKWPVPNVSGFIAQLVRASHRYREVTGSNPVEVLNFSGFCTQMQKLRS